MYSADGNNKQIKFDTRVQCKYLNSSTKSDYYVDKVDKESDNSTKNGMRTKLKCKYTSLKKASSLGGKDWKRTGTFYNIQDFVQPRLGSISNDNDVNKSSIRKMGRLDKTLSKQRSNGDSRVKSRSTRNQLELRILNQKFGIRKNNNNIYSNSSDDDDNNDNNDLGQSRTDSSVESTKFVFPNTNSNENQHVRSSSLSSPIESDSNDSQHQESLESDADEQSDEDTSRRLRRRRKTVSGVPLEVLNINTKR